jgi:hypothetical protein
LECVRKLIRGLPVLRLLVRSLLTLV